MVLSLLIQVCKRGQSYKYGNLDGNPWKIRESDFLRLRLLLRPVKLRRRRLFVAGFVPDLA